MTATDLPRGWASTPADLTALGTTQDRSEKAGPASARRRPPGLLVERALRRRLVAADVVAVGSAWSVLGAATAWHRRPSASGAVAAVLIATGTTLFTVAALRTAGLHRPALTAARGSQLSRLLWCGVLAGLIGTLFARGVGLPLTVVAAGASSVLTALCLAAARALFSSWLSQSRARGRFTRPLLLVGPADEVRTLAGVLVDHPELGYRVCPTSRRPSAPSGTAGQASDLANARWAARRLGAAVLVTAAGTSSPELNQLVRALHEEGIDVYLSPGIFGIDQRRLRPCPVGHEPLMYLEPVTSHRWERGAKRVIDVVVAASLMVFALPVLAVAAVAIRAEDHGPILFRQARLGLGGRSITVLKLRTMVVGAESLVSRLEQGNERSGPLFKMRDDPRVTRIGRVLRATSIDELPQLVNVLRGDMSIVGPRPPLSTEAARFDAAFLHRFDVPPGITGLWQLEARDNPSFSAYRRLDLFYVDNWSISLDVSIMLSTAAAVVARGLRQLTGGARPPVPAQPAGDGCGSLLRPAAGGDG